MYVYQCPLLLQFQLTLIAVIARKQCKTIGVARFDSEIFAKQYDLVIRILRGAPTHNLSFSRIVPCVEDRRVWI